MKIQLLKPEDRGKMKNEVFEGRTLFSNGMASTVLPQSFGALYVFNDDILYPKSHLGMHPHKNVEIVTLMISGTESHRDTLGAHEEYQTGDVQLLSSGKGLYHEGGNVSETENARHLQIWIAPSELDLNPSVQVLRRGQITENSKEKLLVSPNGTANSLSIHQEVWIYQIDVQIERPYNYQLNNRRNGVLIYVLEGVITINGVEAQKEYAIFISETGLLQISALSTISAIILIETIL